MNDDEIFKEEVFRIIDNQIEDKDPKETAQTLKKLKKMGMSDEEAKTLIGKCLSIELMDVIENGSTYNHKRYISNLKRLPIEPSQQ